MSAVLIPATLEHLLAIAPCMRARDRYEVEGTDGADLQAWARSRLVSEILYACVTGAVVQFVVGVIRGRKGAGYVWFVGREGWQRYAKHLLRLWRAGRMFLRYPRIEAHIYADNTVARRFAERLGFQYEGPLPVGNRRGESIAIYSIKEA